MTTVKTLYKSCDCLLQNLTFSCCSNLNVPQMSWFLQPQKRISENSGRGLDGWNPYTLMNCNNQGSHNFITHPWYFTAVKNMEEPKWIFIIPQKVECFPKNLFQLHKFMQGLLTWGEGTCLNKFALPTAGTSCPIYYPCVFPAGWDLFVLLFNSSFLEVQ